MYKVMIVDDERQIIDGLCKMIKWRELGFEVAATARNGLEAIAWLKSAKVDLVLTDVRMPGMDGLTMLETVRRTVANDMEFIILSGFSDFQYARKAMQYNVKNYILKPVDEAELYGALIEIKGLLDEKEIRRSLKIKSCINDFIAGGQPEDGIGMLAGEEQSGLRYIAIERRLDYSAFPSAPAEPGAEDITKCIAEKIGEYNMRFAMRHDRDVCHIVAGHSLLSSFEYDAKRLASSVGEFLRITKSIQADVMVGKKVPGFKDIHESIQSVAACRNRLFYLPKASVVMYDDVRDKQYCKVYKDDGSAIRIISAFRKNDTEKLMESLGALTEHFESLRVVPEVAQIQLDGVLASIVQILSERREDVGEVLERYAAYKKMQSRAGLVDLNRMASQFCLYCIDFSLNRCGRGHEDIAARVARYVDEFYAQPIKINDIAERFFVNPAYLGQQFAKKKGCSLNHYINMVRIEKAKELLAYTNRRIYEIAVETGFEDPNYFSSKFLEYTGCAPTDYRNRNCGS